VLEFIKKLFGFASDTPPDSSSTTSSGPSAGHGSGSPIRGMEHVSGVENIRVTYGKAIKTERGATLVEDPDDKEQRWLNTWNRAISPSQWTDEWGPVAAKDIDSFWHHKTEFDMLQSGDPLAAEQKIQGFGYRDVGHLFQVETTFLKHFGTPSHGPQLDDMVWDADVVSKAAMAGAMRFNQSQQSAAIAANPELLAPVEGVDLETYATVAAAAASGLPQDQFAALLAKHGMDVPKWTRVNGAWTDRMSKDTSGAIAMAYSRAFGSAGQGQYGAAGAAGAATLGGGSVQAAAGGEPMPFERYCEIQGAMSAWSTNGLDVNAMLKHTFDMNAQDWSMASMWWMTHMQSDLSYFTKWEALTKKYEEQYGANANKGADDDLAF
jgi:hypothetical protein